MAESEPRKLGRDIAPRKPSIKLVGVGGAGCNTIADSPFETAAICTPLEETQGKSFNQYIRLKDEEVEFFKETSFKALCSLNFDLKETLSKSIGNRDLIFVFTGLGGDTGSYVTPIVSNICKKQSKLCMTSVALPFSVEGKERKSVADYSLSNIYRASDITVTYPNDQLLKMVPHLPMRKAFQVMNRIMMLPVEELEKALTTRDIEPLRKDFLQAKYSRLGMGTGKGDRRAAIALNEALTSPWFDFDDSEVRAGLVTISSGKVKKIDIEDVVRNVSQTLLNVNISYSVTTDDSLGEKMRVMLLLGVG